MNSSLQGQSPGFGLFWSGNVRHSLSYKQIDAWDSEGSEEETWENDGKHMGRIVKTCGGKHQLPRFRMFCTVEPWWSPTFSKGNWMLFSRHLHLGLKVQPSLHSSSSLDTSKVWKTTVFSCFSHETMFYIYFQRIT